MAEFKILITKTETSEIIIKAEDEVEAQEIIDTAIEEKAIAFCNKPKYKIAINQLGV